MPNKADKPAAADRIREFEEIVSKYEAMLLRYAARIVADPDAAQDIVQNVFIKLFRSWRDDMDASPHLSSWLYRVTHNEAVDYLRGRERRRLLCRRQITEQPSAAPARSGSSSEIGDAAVRANEMLNKLDLRERQLVILKVYEEKSYKEISEITGLSVSNVGYILHHAMKKLSGWLIFEPQKSAETGSGRNGN